MNPVHFASSREPLFGVYHAPQVRGAGMGVVLCPPFGQEYMRTHRALKQLASQLSRSGAHAFRFDYFGTGDSAGTSGAGGPIRWIADIEAAASELGETAELASLSLVGLRLGGLLAAGFAKANRKIGRLVLWDPVLDGRAYAAELRAQAGPGALPGVPGVHGFPFPESIASELEGLRMPELLSEGTSEVMIVVSKPNAACEAMAREARSSRISVRHIPSAGDWEDMDRLGAALLPQQIIRGIVSWLTGPVPEAAA